MGPWDSASRPVLARHLLLPRPVRPSLPLTALIARGRTANLGESDRRIHQELRLPVMADISTLDEALAAAEAGADCVGPTLNGYTESTRDHQNFDWSLLAQLTQQLHIPIMAEGHISSPEEARQAIQSGAWCVIVGSAITRPGVIAARFARAAEQASSSVPAIGVDIGGTWIKAGLVQRCGEVRFIAQTPTHSCKGREAIVSGLVQVVEEVLKACRQKHIEPQGLGIATAGAVDHRDGSIFAATDNLPGWSGFQLRALAEERFHLPTFIVNDAQAAVLSELHFGLGRGLTDFIVLTIGTGIGGGIVSERKLLRGQHGFAGSIGHTVIRAGDGHATAAVWAAWKRMFRPPRCLGNTVTAVVPPQKTRGMTLLSRSKSTSLPAVATTPRKALMLHCQRVWLKESVICSTNSTRRSSSSPAV